MIRSNKLFLIVVIVGVVVILGLSALLYWGDYNLVPTYGEENPEVETPTDQIPQATEKVDDLVDSLEDELNEEMNGLYQQMQEDYESVIEDEEDLKSLGDLEDVEL